MWRYDFVKRDANGNPVDTNGVPVSDGNYVIEHGSTERVMGSNPDGNHHYKDIALHVDRILNFYNAEDLALTAWEFNQLTKPDSAQGIDWFYTNSYRMAYSEYETCLFYNSDAANQAEYCTDKFPEIPESVIAQFELGGEIVPYNDANAFDILAHAIPARTEPLGQVITLGEITSNSNFDGFTDSNQDHSAPFHGYYSEISLDSGTRERASYWNTVLEKSLRLREIDDHYTNLKNQILSR